MLRKTTTRRLAGYFAPSQTAIVAPSLVVISAWVAGSLRTRATHCKPLSIGTATWAIRTVNARQAVPDQWLSFGLNGENKEQGTSVSCYMK